MSYLIDSVAVKPPDSLTEANATQQAQQQALSGSVGVDLFGDNKRVWVFTYKNCKKSAYDTINAIYQSYLNDGVAKTFQSTETNYVVAATTVHVNVSQRSFSVQGADYISDFTLTLVEA